MTEEDRLTAIITKRLRDYMSRTPNEGAGLYEKFIPAFVEAALKYPLFKNNPDILPTIFIQETSAGRNITRAGNAINYGVNSPTISKQFAKGDIVENLRSAIKEMGETGTVYRKFDTGKPMTDKELEEFAKTYEPKNSSYPKFLKEGRQTYNDISAKLGSSVLGVRTKTDSPTLTPTTSPTTAPTIAQVREQQVAYPTPTVSPAVPKTTSTSKDYSAKEINAEYASKSPIMKLLYAPVKTVIDVSKGQNPLDNLKGLNIFKPKPAFSAESDSLDKAISNFVEGNIVTNPYGAKNAQLYGSSSHRGTDYRAAENSKVFGVNGWKVLDVYSAPQTGNNVVIINPQTGERIKFSHLNKSLVKRGDTIDGSSPIALSGNTGTSTTGAHLHVEYMDANGQTADVTKLAQSTQKKQPSIADKLSGMFTPKPAMAAEQEPPYSQKGWEQSQANLIQDKTKSGEYFGKSQGSYQIKPGDTLANLAKQYGATVNDFVRANPTIKNPNMIRAGETITVPSSPTTSSSKEYVIRSGDNLSTIAKNLGTTVNDIVRKNNIANPNLIYAGTKIKF